MSQTLLLASRSDSSLPRPQFDLQHHTLQQQAELRAKIELEQGSAPIIAPSQHDLMLASVLAPFASHHHLSDYHRSKRGENGAALKYAPLSIVLPAHVASLKEKQASFIHTSTRLFFDCTSTTRILAVPEFQPPLTIVTNVSSLLTSKVVTESQTGLSSALPTPSSSSSTKSRPRVSFATSASSLSASPSSSPLPRSAPPITPPPSSTLSNDLQVAISSNFIPRSSPSLASRSLTTSPNRPPFLKLSSWSPDLAPPTPSSTLPTIVPRTSETHPINVSSIIPPDLLAVLPRYLFKKPAGFPIIFGTEPGFEFFKAVTTASATNAELTVMPPPPGQSSLLNESFVIVPSQGDSPISLLPSPLPAPSPSFSHLSGSFPQANSTPVSNALLPSTPRTAIETYSKPSNLLLQNNVILSIPPMPSYSPHLPSQSSSGFKLGNIILSSCPGKKVRLGGVELPPGVPSRSAINRSLSSDFARIASPLVNAKLIICCLDDDELQFLGAPWPEYVAEAHRAGLDVWRCPMPEGLAPVNFDSVDEMIDEVLRKYTLNGMNILAHCRGGVGRAGLIACCWLIKLGLCGDIDPQAESPALGYVRKDALSVVQTAIRVVRLRRSLKAIETYEQVRFLVEYVEHLRVKSRQ